MLNNSGTPTPSEDTPVIEKLSPAQEIAERRYEVYKEYEALLGHPDVEGVQRDQTAYINDRRLLTEVLDTNLGLATRYLEFAQNHNGRPLSLDPVFKLILERPVIADNLYSVFEKYPELISSYTFGIGARKEIVKDGEVQKVDSFQINTRLYNKEGTASDVAEALQRNQDTFNSLTAKMGAEEWVDAAVVEGLGVVSLQRLNPTVPVLDAVRVVLRSDEAVSVYNFSNFEFEISARGLVSSTASHIPVGYLLMHRGHVSEGALISALKKFDFGSEALKETLGKYKVDGGVVGLVEYAEEG